MALTKINTKLIANNTIALTNIADNAVDATKIASNSILTRHIDDDQITADQIVDDIALAGNISTTGNFGVGAAPTNGGVSTAGSPVLSISGAVPELNFVDTDSGKNDYWIRVSDGLQFGEASDSRMYLKNGGNLGIGNTTATTRLQITGTSTEEDVILLEDNSGTDVGAIRIHSGAFMMKGKSATAPVQMQTHDGNEDIEVDPDGFIKMETAGSERLRIDSSGRMIIGHTASIDNGSHPRLQVYHSGSSGHVGIGRWGASASPPFLTFVKSRSSTVGNNTIVQDGDNLGKIRWRPADGNDFESEAASIYARVDGTPGQDDMPGELYFATTNDGGSSAVTRMIIKADGKVGIGETSPTAQLDVRGATGSGTLTHALFTGTTGRGFEIRTRSDVSGGQHSGTAELNSKDSEGTGGDIALSSNGNIRMFIDGGGSVGIGTTSPSEKLHVYDGSSSAAIRVSGEGNVNRKIEIGYDTSDGPVIRAGSSGQVGLKFYYDNTSLGALLHTNGDWYTNDGTVHSLSDARVKDNVADLTDGLDIVKQLKPRTFKYNSKAEFYNEKIKDETKYGFIADEVKAVAPQYTTTQTGKIDGKEVDDLKSLSATKMIPMLVKAIQELSTELEAAKARITTLEG